MKMDHGSHCVFSPQVDIEDAARASMDTPLDRSTLYRYQTKEHRMDDLPCYLLVRVAASITSVAPLVAPVVHMLHLGSSEYIEYVLLGTTQPLNAYSKPVQASMLVAPQGRRDGTRIAPRNSGSETKFPR